MAGQWTAEAVLGTTQGFQSACVVTAAAELDVFTRLRACPSGPGRLAEEMGADLRGLTVLLDALAAMGLLEKHGREYEVPSDVAELLTETGSRSVLGMVRHRGNCLRRWAELATVVETGRAADGAPSIRGESEDMRAFIEAMHEVSAPLAESLVDELGPPTFRHLLDVGGASGTWTIAFLRAVPEATATLFDRPEVIPLTRRRIDEAHLADRVTLVGGDFYSDELPGGADLAWVSAIAHQNSPEQNVSLFSKVLAALRENGRIYVRDVVMGPSRTDPPAGALFAVNMLVCTTRGGTYTFDELSEALGTAGFTRSALLRSDEFMSSVVVATKPGRAK